MTRPARIRLLAGPTAGLWHRVAGWSPDPRVGATACGVAFCWLGDRIRRGRGARDCEACR